MPVLLDAWNLSLLGFSLAALCLHSRTLDPQEADYFYVPVHVSCLADVIGKADKPIWPDDVPGVGMWREFVLIACNCVRITMCDCDVGDCATLCVCDCVYVCVTVMWVCDCATVCL